MSAGAPSAASRSAAGMLTSLSWTSASTRRSQPSRWLAIAVATALPLPSGAGTTSTPASAAMSAEASVDALSTNHTASPACAAAWHCSSTRPSVAASLWPTTANVQRSELRMVGEVMVGDLVGRGEPRIARRRDVLQRATEVAKPEGGASEEPMQRNRHRDARAPPGGAQSLELVDERLGVLLPGPASSQEQ